MERLKKFIIPILFVIGVLFCYRDYIFGNKYFIFTGVASDSLVQTFPNLYRLAYLLEHGENIIGHDFVRGYGASKNISTLNIFYWVILFGTKALPYLMGISQILKIFLSYALFYFYLKVLGRSYTTCHIGAISYALCGHMIIRHYWNAYPNEVVLSALVLLCLELSISKKNHKWLPLALCLYCSMGGSYRSVLIIAIVMGYTILRYFELHNFELKGFLKTFIVPAVSFFIAFILGAVYILQPMLSSLTSSRLEKGVQTSAAKEWLYFTDFDTLMTAVLRTLSVDWAGIESMNIGTGNILGTPTFFCGILMLIMIPVAIYSFKGQKKVVSIIVFLFALSYIVFPELRRIINGFSGTGFKLSSFWIIILMIYYGTQGLQYWLEEQDKTNYVGIIISSLIIIISTITYVVVDNLDFKIYIRIVITTIMYLILTICAKKLTQFQVGAFLFIIVFFDMFSNAYSFCNTTMAVTNNELEMYNDQAINYIKEIDSNDFYRIERKYDSGNPSASLVQNYYGTQDYVGGTGMNEYMHEFLNQMNIARRNAKTKHNMTGLTNSNTLYSLLGVKYLLTQDTMDNEFGLQFIEKIGDTSIYINENVLPIGFGYDNYISETEFEKLDIEDRRMHILNSCVLRDDDVVHTLNQFYANDVDYDLEGRTIPFSYNIDEMVLSFDEISEDKVLVLECNTIGSREDFNEILYGNSIEELGTVYIGVSKGEAEQYYAFSGNNISYLKFISNSLESLKDIELKIYDKESYYAYAKKCLKERSKYGFECTFFSNNKIQGTVNNNKDCMMYFNIPYDEGWNIYVDGEKTDKNVVNYGFIGVFIESGNHDVVLEYKIHNMLPSVAVSVLGIIFVLCWQLYWFKKEKSM